MWRDKILCSQISKRAKRHANKMQGHFIWETSTGTNFPLYSIVDPLRDYVERYYGLTTRYMQQISRVRGRKRRTPNIRDFWLTEKKLATKKTS